jgi:hypothetical protein
MYLNNNSFMIYIINSPFKADLFKIQNYLGHILDNTGNGRELMVYTFDLYCCDGKTLE